MSPRAAWDFWTDVSNWTLDAAIEWVRLDRPFGVGARGTTRSRGAAPMEWLVKEAEPPTRATIEVALPGALVTFEWRFEPGAPGGTRITQRARLSGPQAADFLAVADSELAANMPAGMLKLADAMERSRNPTVRPARAADAARVAEIYNQGIAERNATFETAPRTAEAMERRIAEDPARYPVLVAEHDGAVVGWASLGSYRSRECYAGVSEFSVYIDRDHRGSGVGRRLLEALIATAAACGHWKLLSRVFPSNTASLALCRSLGFREVGVYEKHGRLEGRWLDVVIVERLIPENQG